MSKKIYYEPRMTGEKECKDCKRILPVIAFAVNSHNKDGLYNTCRECQREEKKITYRKTHKIGVRKTAAAEIRSRLWPDID